MNNITVSTSTILAPQASPLKPPIFFPNIFGIALLKTNPIKIRNKFLINVTFEVSENDWYVITIKRKIIDIKDSFLNPFQYFL